MPTITSSTFVLGHQQHDGRRYVKETHIWDSGLPPTTREYGPVPDTVDHQAIADARAVRLMAEAAEAEIDQIIGSD